MRTMIALLGFILLATPGFTPAQSTPRIDQRQEKQDARIDKGVASGKLTQKEASRLEKGQVRIDRMEGKALSDGKVTKEEKRRIEKAQDRQNKQIRREAKDDQKK